MKSFEIKVRAVLLLYFRLALPTGPLPLLVLYHNNSTKTNPAPLPPSIKTFWQCAEACHTSIKHCKLLRRGLSAARPAPSLSSCLHLHNGLRLILIGSDRTRPLTVYRSCSASVGFSQWQREDTFHTVVGLWLRVSWIAEHIPLTVLLMGACKRVCVRVCKQTWEENFWAKTRATSQNNHTYLHL